MKVIMWKKWVEMKKTKSKLIFFIIFPALLILIYLYLLEVDFYLFFKIVPLIICCWSYFIFYTVDDIAYASLYSIVGIKPKDSWIGNIMFSTEVSIFVTAITLFILLCVNKKPIMLTDIILSALTILIAMALIGLNTLHYVSNSKKANITASVFGIINILIVALPVLLSNFYDYISKVLDIGIIVLAVIALIILLITFRYMKKDNIESLVMNSKIYIEGYDKNFFNEN